jgi:predicted nucleic-acid-binding Zn-ribbon protein
MVLELNIENAHYSDVTAIKCSIENPEFFLSGSSTGEIKVNIIDFIF